MLRLPKNPLWPVRPSWRFADEGTPGDAGGDASGGGGAGGTPPADKKADAKPPSHWVGEDKDLASFVDNKGWKSPSDVTKGYRELEKKIGTMLQVPGADAKDEDWAKLSDKLRPRNVSEYAIGKLELPEGARDEALEAAMDAHAHEQGWPAKWWKSAKTKLFEAYGKQITDLDAQAAKIRADDEKTMRLKWGQEYDGNVALADKAMAKTGLKDLLKQVGLDTHPLIQAAFQQMSAFLEEMKPPDGKGGPPEEKGQWFTGYDEVKPKKG